MFIRTFHHTLLMRLADGRLHQVDIGDYAGNALSVADLAAVAPALLPHVADANVKGTPGAFTVEGGGVYLCANGDLTVAHNRPAASIWETFELVPENIISDLAASYADRQAEQDRLARRVAALAAAGQPVKLHFGAGRIPLPGFLNIDIAIKAPRFAAEHRDDYFVLPYVGVRLPIPDASVDYIFHEDFIEHIDQLSQIQFLTECWRLLKPGAIHRVNTPNLIWTMATRSDFARGNDGVYTGELQWGHVALFTPASLEETARMIGYSDIVFNGRGRGISPYAIVDRRPGSDRDEVAGNIFADLTK